MTHFDKDGGKCNGIDFEVAGMQKLVNAVRATGATNICMLGGLQWSNSLTQWLKYRPHDPTGIYSSKAYEFSLKFPQEILLPRGTRTTLTTAIISNVGINMLLQVNNPFSSISIINLNIDNK